MTRLQWDYESSKYYQAGVDRGVYYGVDSIGIPWNGLVSVVEKTDIDEDSPLYLDGIKIANRRRFGDFAATIEAVSYPEEFNRALRRPFGLCYRVQTADHYQIHLVYNALAFVSDRDFGTVTDTPDVVMFGFDISTMRSKLDRNRRVSHLIIDERYARPEAISEIESILYGDDSSSSRLPTPEEVLEVFESHAILRVTELDDGSYEIRGPDDAVYKNMDGSWTITWPSVILIDDHTYQISSL